MLTTYICTPVALIPHLEAVNFNLEAFISVLHSVGGGALVMFYILMADGYVVCVRVRVCVCCAECMYLYVYSTEY